MRAITRLILALLIAAPSAALAQVSSDPYAALPRQPVPAATYPQSYAPPGATFSEDELVDAGHAFFGETSAGLGTALEHLLSRFGEPNGYVLGEEASGAILGGLRYGEGTLHTSQFGQHPVFWQGPSFGWDFGGAGTRVMMLVYKMPSVDAFMQRFAGVDGSAYLVGGLSLTVMLADDMVLVPVRTGVGARLGVSLGYLKFTPQPTWNPF